MPVSTIHTLTATVSQTGYCTATAIQLIPSVLQMAACMTMTPCIVVLGRFVPMQTVYGLYLTGNACSDCTRPWRGVIVAIASSDR